jgi:hypothetical protein
MLMEKIFTTYLNTGANLAVITKQIGDTLEDNHRIFTGCGNLVHAAAAISGGINVLADYNKRLNDSFIGGVRKMQDLIYNHENIGMIGSSNSSFKKVVEEIRSFDHRQHSMLESYVSDKR